MAGGAGVTMAQLLSPDTFEFFATYLLAGYVVIIVRSRFILGVRPKPAELVIEAIVFSLVNQMLATLIADLSNVTGLSTWLDAILGLPDSDSRLFFFLKVLVLPALLGMVLGYNLSAGWKNALLRRLSMPVTHPVRKGYDFAFGNERDTGLVEITYDDGTKIAGLFGEHSLAASDEDRSDLYLEQLYIIDNGNWKETKPPRSVWLSLRDVRSIEFLQAPEEQETQRND